MRFMEFTFFGAILLGIFSSALGQGTPPPCRTAEHRAFDFWIGEWNVHGVKGKLAGTNSIKPEYGGCVLHERYDTGRGYSGESFNIYDANRKSTVAFDGKYTRK